LLYGLHNATELILNNYIAITFVIVVPIIDMRWRMFPCGSRRLAFNVGHDPKMALGRDHSQSQRWSLGCKPAWCWP
jgi:hypothetical protein